MLVHTPVLLEEALHFLEPRPGGRFIDATLGAGGHTRAILERTSPDGRMLAIDRDASAIDQAKQYLQSFGSRLQIVKANFRDIAAIAEAQGFIASDGVLAD